MSYKLLLPATALGVALTACARHNAPLRYEQTRQAQVIGPPTAAFPLSVSANGRYLVGADGKPWRLQAEFAWLLSVKASAADMDAYLADRKAKGFNAFTVFNIVRPGGTYGWPAFNTNDQAPFLTDNDLSKPNDNYFDTVDTLLDKAAAQGFAVLLFYTYAGYNGGNEGWYEIVAQPQNTKEVCYNFGRYLASRWKDKPNIVLMAGGDFTMPAGETRDRMHEIHRGLRDGGCKHLGGSEWGGPDSLITDQEGYTYGVQPTSDLNLNSWYGQGPNLNGRVFETADRAWRNKPTLPSYMEEAMQGYGKYVPLDSSRQSIRKYQHWAVLSGSAAGTNWGLFELANQFVDGQWQGQLDDIMAKDQARAFTLYSSVPWWLMRPSGTAADYAGRNLIVSTNNRDDSFVSSSLASDGSTLLAYVPPTGSAATSIDVDLRGLAGASRARWWNPTSGAFIDISGGDYSLANTVDKQDFKTPGDNGTGQNDWMLVLDSKEKAEPGTGGPSNSAGSSASGGSASVPGPPSGGSSSSASGSGSGRASDGGTSGSRASSSGQENSGSPSASPQATSGDDGGCELRPFSSRRSRLAVLGGLLFAALGLSLRAARRK